MRTKKETTANMKKGKHTYTLTHTKNENKNENENKHAKKMNMINEMKKDTKNNIK